MTISDAMGSIKEGRVLRADHDAKAVHVYSWKGIKTPGVVQLVQNYLLNQLES